MGTSSAVRVAWLAGAVLVASGCAHHTLSGGDLDRVVRPAFISRIEDGAGPRSSVFREDNAYGGKLKKLEPKEADRRLAVKLAQGAHRFEISDRLRATTLSHLPAEKPWTAVVNPAQVATVLESFLVEEVPANPPDYELLKPLGADAVVEFVMQEYGMRSEHGVAGAYFRGYARMFFIDGGEIWRHPIAADGVKEGRPHLDPFKVAKDPELYRNELSVLLDEIAEACAEELSPKNRRGGPAVTPGSSELSTPSDTVDQSAGKRAAPELAPGELPSPDGTPEVPPPPTDEKPSTPTP